ncbi:YdcF family protein, partial [Actinomyces sp.]
MIDIVLWLPTLVWGAIFIWSYRREPRQFRNAFFFFFLCASALGALSSQLDQWWIILPIGLAVALAPFITIIFMLVNEVQLVRREGFSLSHALPLLFACAIVAWFLAVPLALVVQAPGLVLGFLFALTLCGAWFFLSFTALLLYSWLYRSLPRKRQYDFIVIHGAGLNGTDLTPLLRGRVDRAYDLWVKQDKKGVFVPSGGRGADEEISEAEAMARYLRLRGVPDSVIVLEDRSTTTWENLTYSRDLITRLSSATPERAALVTSDYHVF